MVAALLLLVTIPACSGGAPAPLATSIADKGGDVPAEQRAALADGHVTLAEYQAAFAKWEKCVTEGGGLLKAESRDPKTGLITYQVGARLGTPEQPRADSVEARCYHAYFDVIETAYTEGNPLIRQQEQSEAIKNYQTMDRPCLLRNGIAAPANIVFDSDLFRQLIAKAGELENEGKCSSGTDGG